MTSRRPISRLGLPPAGGGDGGGHLEGQLTEALVAGGTASVAVYTIEGSTWTISSRTATIKDRAGWSGGIGDYVCWISINGEDRPVVIGCPNFVNE